jgi:hypothetical protein
MVIDVAVSTNMPIYVQNNLGGLKSHEEC